MRTNDPVMLSWLQAYLKESHIPVFILDNHTSIIEGSIGAIPRRVMVDSEDIEAARRLLDAADIAYAR